uniref:Uncharacterized protein n=1 Tax=Rhizophora mucronata TaxID=61149 RepID=A0A2P2K6V0_RHIMU
MMSHHQLMLHPGGGLGVNPSLCQDHPRWRTVTKAVEAALVLVDLVHHLDLLVVQYNQEEDRHQHLILAPCPVSDRSLHHKDLLPPQVNL